MYVLSFFNWEMSLSLGQNRNWNWMSNCAIKVETLPNKKTQEDGNIWIKRVVYKIQKKTQFSWYSSRSWKTKLWPINFHKPQIGPKPRKWIDPFSDNGKLEKCIKNWVVSSFANQNAIICHAIYMGLPLYL